MPISWDQLQGKLAAIGRDLTDEDDVAQAWAEATVIEGRRRAAGRPTPQARMASTGVRALAGAIAGAGIVSGRGGSVPVGAIFWGSEFGSSIYRQFGPRHSRGSWLYPAGESDAVLDRVERLFVDPVLDRHI